MKNILTLVVVLSTLFVGCATEPPQKTFIPEMVDGFTGLTFEEIQPGIFAWVNEDTQFTILVAEYEGDIGSFRTVAPNGHIYKQASLIYPRVGVGNTFANLYETVLTSIEKKPGFSYYVIFNAEGEEPTVIFHNKKLNVYFMGSDIIEE